MVNVWHKWRVSLGEGVDRTVHANDRMMNRLNVKIESILDLPSG
jgi:hypothetical protein